MAFLANETFNFKLIEGHQVEIVDNSASTVIAQTSQLSTISTPSSTSSSEPQSMDRPKYI
jgi:hypothetical protein